MSEQETGTSHQAQAVSPAWDRIERARHPQRPYPMDFIERIFTDFSEIHGDRAFGDDEAVACGMARLGDEEVMVIGNRKGGSTKERVRRNFGMPHPEGYRKALRCHEDRGKVRPPGDQLHRSARRLSRPGRGRARPGRGHRPQSFSKCRGCACPPFPSSAAKADRAERWRWPSADRVLILENALYFVITPESCAAIMWRDAAHKQLAAEAMRISAPEVAALGCVDEIVAEPPGGIHTDREAGTGMLGRALKKHLAELKAMPVDALVAARQHKFRNIAQFYTEN